MFIVPDTSFIVDASFSVSSILAKVQVLGKTSHASCLFQMIFRTAHLAFQQKVSSRYQNTGRGEKHRIKIPNGLSGIHSVRSLQVEANVN